MLQSPYLAFDILVLFGEVVAELLNAGIIPSSHKKTTTPEYVFFAKRWVEVLVSKGSTKKDAFDMLETFLGAHLIHCPQNRSQATIPSGNIQLQATAKGFACLENWIYGLSVPSAARFNQVRDALFTPYNSMDLLVLCRSQSSQRLHVSTALVIVLWRRMLGEEPQRYCSFNSICTTPKTARKRPALVLNPLNVPRSYKYPVHKAAAATEMYADTDSGNNSNENEQFTEQGKEDVPYFVRSMIHPNSMNIMQYWDTRGVQIFSNLRFEKCRKNKFSNTEVYGLDFVVSGHAIWQWIMDCTSVVNATEATMLAREMIHSGFISRIRDPVVDAVAAASSSPFSVTHTDNIHRSISKNALYQFTPRGRRLCWWGHAYLEDECVDKELLIEESNFSLYYANHRDQYDTDSEDDHDEDNDDMGIINTHPVTFCSGISGNVKPYSPALSPNHMEVEQPAISQLPLAPPDRMRAKWKWEYRTCVGIDDRFNEYVDLSLIMREPGLKLLFKETLRKMHCTAALDFIDLSRKLQHLIHALRDAHGTVTRLPQLQKECTSTALLLQQQFIDVGAPLELNIGERDRQMWSTAIMNAKSSRNFSHLEPALQHLTQQSCDILASVVLNFNLSEITRRFPCLRHYIVANHTPRIKYEEMVVSKPTYLYA